MDQRITAPVTNFTDLLLDAVCMVDVSGCFVYVSAACERIFGYTQQEMIGKVMIDMVAPDDRARTLAAARSIMDGHPNSGFENRYVHKDGSLVHIMWSARWSEADQLRVAVARDVTANKQADTTQAALYAISEAAHATDDVPALFHLIHQIIGGLLPAHCFTVALMDNQSQRLYFAYHAAQDGPAPHAPLAESLCEQIMRSGEPQRLTPDVAPELSHACWMGVPLTTSSGRIGVLLLQSAPDAAYTARDQDLLLFVSTQIATAIQRKQLHAQLRYMAQHDELTQLPNRRLFHDRLTTAFARAQRHQGKLSLLFIDLNKFKQVNDDYGHACGDLLLREVACRIRDCVRATDTVARIGGDEFVVILEDLGLPEHASLVKEKIHLALALPIDLGEGRSLRTAASIGLAHYPDDGTEIQQLLRHADQAMYASKLDPSAA